MSYKWNELAQIPDEELIAAYDQAAEHTAVGINYFRDELVWRRQQRAAEAQWEQAEEAKALNAKIVLLTESIRSLTLLLFGLTAVMAAAALGQVVAPLLR